MSPTPYSIPPAATTGDQPFDEHDAHLTLAAAIVNHLDDMGENATTQQQEDKVEGLRADFDTLLDAGGDLVTFAAELDVDLSVYAGGTDGAR